MLHPRSLSGARRWTLVGLLTVVLALCAALLPAHPAHATRSASFATGGSTIHALVNDARFANGQSGLLRNAALDAVAAAWAGQLAVAGTLSHNPDYTAQIPGGWVAAAENVAQGQPTEAAMHDAWMSSPGHRANVLGDYTDVGIAFVSAGGTTWGVEVFASYPSHVGPEAPAPPAAAEPAPAPAPAESAAAEAAPAPSPPKGRASPASASSGEDDAAADPTPTTTPTPTATADPRTPATHRSTASRASDTADAAPTQQPADSFGMWLWIGIPSLLGAAAIAGGILVLRARGLIGRPGGRHSAG